MSAVANRATAGGVPKNAGDGPLGWLYAGSTDPSAPLDGRFIIENYSPVARLIDAAPHTVMHGDAHPGNCYFRRGGAAYSTGKRSGAAIPPASFPTP